MKTYKDWICRYYSEHEDGEPDGEIIQELIRCKACRWFRNDDEGTWCVAWAGQNTNPDAFCSYAQPKERGR